MVNANSTKNAPNTDRPTAVRPFLDLAIKKKKKVLLNDRRTSHTNAYEWKSDRDGDNNNNNNADTDKTISCRRRRYSIFERTTKLGVSVDSPRTQTTNSVASRYHTRVINMWFRVANVNRVFPVFFFSYGRKRISESGFGVRSPPPLPPLAFITRDSERYFATNFANIFSHVRGGAKNRENTKTKNGTIHKKIFLPLRFEKLKKKTG